MRKNTRRARGLGKGLLRTHAGARGGERPRTLKSVSSESRRSQIGLQVGSPKLGETTHAVEQTCPNHGTSRPVGGTIFPGPEEQPARIVRKHCFFTRKSRKVPWNNFLFRGSKNCSMEQEIVPWSNFLTHGTENCSTAASLGSTAPPDVFNELAAAANPKLACERLSRAASRCLEASTQQNQMQRQDLRLSLQELTEISKHMPTTVLRSHVGQSYSGEHAQPGSSQEIAHVCTNM